MSLDDFGQGKVTLVKDDLLRIMRENRDRHREVFLAAQAGFRDKVIVELETMLTDAREGKKLRTRVRLLAPQEHTSEYDCVIHMLEMSTAAEISISQRQFAQFVRDTWDWKNDFLKMSNNYAVGATSRAYGVVVDDEDNE